MRVDILGPSGINDNIVDKPRGLVIEDGYAGRYSIACGLRRLGFQTSTFESPKRVLEIIERSPGRFQVLAVSFPLATEMGAMELADAAREVDPSIRTILLSERPCARSLREYLENKGHIVTNFSGLEKMPFPTFPQTPKTGTVLGAIREWFTKRGLG